MANSGIFPIFLRAEYRDDGKAFRGFQSDAARAAAAAKKEFAGVGAALDAALTRGRTGSGSLDLGIDELRRAAAAQQQVAIAAREVAEATKRAATANGQFDAGLSRATRSAFEYANAQERVSREMLEQVAALDRVQAELNGVASATDAATAASRRSSTVGGQQRQGLQQLSLQLNDVATQYALGASATQIFAAQSGQVIQAVQLMNGGTSRLAAFLAGPWGLALTSAAIVAAPFIGKLLEGRKSADELADALGSVKFASSAVGDAQSILGSVFDVTTGKIKDQTAATLALARAQLQVQLVQARLQGTAAQQTLQEAARRRVVVPGSQTVQVSAPGAPLAINPTAQIPRTARSVSAVVAEQALKGDTEGALREILRLQEAGKTTVEIFAEISAAAGNLGVSRANVTVIENALKALDGDRKALSGFLKPNKGGKDSGAEARRVARETERLANFGDRAAESIARVNERFDEQPRLIDQASQATRQLDALMKELGERKPAGFESLIAEAERAKATVQDALLRPFAELRRESQERLQIEELLAAGREDEAAALSEVFRLQRQIGGVTAEQRAEVEAIVRAEAERTRYLRDQQRLFAAQLEVVDQVQRSLTDLLSGRSTDFFANFKQALGDLAGQRLFESLFGDSFRAIRDELSKNTPQGRANAAFAAEVERTASATARVGDAAITLAEEFDRAFGIVRGAANDNPASLGGFNPQIAMVEAALKRVGIDPYGMTVNGLRPGQSADETKIARTSIMELSKRIGEGIVAPFRDTLETVLGRSLGGTIGDAIAGVIAGKATGGTVGAVLGGLEGLTKGIKGLQGVTAKLGQMGGGAATGTMVAGIGQALGIKTSSTGGAIGGALGSVIPGVGTVIGSILGSIVGGLFRRTPRASATIGGVGNGLGVTGVTGNKAELRTQVGGLGGNVLDAINSIAQQLGASLDSSRGSVSIGVRDGKFRVDPTGRGQTETKKGAIDFGEDAQAAVAAAVQDLIRDGVIAGLKASENRLLQAARDVQTGLQDVLTFRGVLDRLRAIKDPIGAAVDQVAKEFDRYRDLFKRAGADASELAQLEELAGIERARAIEEATSRVVGSLKSLLSNLKTGDSGLSLRDRQSNALGQFNALAARVAAGDSSAFDKFAEVAQQLLDIERQLFGSTQSYFDRLAQVTKLTEQAIAGQTNVSSIAEAAGSSASSSDSASITRAVDNQTSELASRLDAIIANQATAMGVRALGGSGNGQSSPVPALVANF